jgi:LysM repeat protein
MQPLRIFAKLRRTVMRKIHLLVFVLIGMFGLALIGFGLTLGSTSGDGNVVAMNSSVATAGAAIDLNTRDSWIFQDAELAAANASDTFLAAETGVSRDDLMLSDDAPLAMDLGVPPAVPPPSALESTAASPAEWRHPSSRFFVHIVRWGETLSGIADRFDTSVWRLARLNGICHPNHIVVGRRLLIPRS